MSLSRKEIINMSAEALEDFATRRPWVVTKKDIEEVRERRLSELASTAESTSGVEPEAGSVRPSSLTDDSEGLRPVDMGDELRSKLSLLLKAGHQDLVDSVLKAPQDWMHVVLSHDGQVWVGEDPRLLEAAVDNVVEKVGGLEALQTVGGTEGRSQDAGTTSKQPGSASSA